MKRDKVLIINPGSTSTKIAVFDFDTDTEILGTNISHSVDDLAGFDRVSDQTNFRLEKILNNLEDANISTKELICVSARGGLVRPIPGGTYGISDVMCEELKAVKNEHASNLGALIGMEIMNMEGVAGYITDPIVVDEMMDIAKVTGVKGINRAAIGHPLNRKAIARKTAEKIGKRYEDSNFIVAHMGGGVTVGMHAKGRVIDTNNGLNGDGPMSPERAGSLPNSALMDLAYNKGMSEKELFKFLVGNGGFVSHLATNDAREVEKMVEEGNEYAKLIYEAMAYQVAKEIAALSVGVNGEIDAIALTGGVAYSNMITNWIIERVKFIAPVYVFPGEGEIKALYEGVKRVIIGEEEAKIY